MSGWHGLRVYFNVFFIDVKIKGLYFIEVEFA